MSTGNGGVTISVAPPSPFAASVLADLLRERQRQVSMYGTNEDLDDGTGPLVAWLPGSSHNVAAEAMLRDDYEQHRARHPLTWMHLLREEFAEAMCEHDQGKLYDELVQVAAVAVSWCENIRRRAGLH